LGRKPTGPDVPKQSLAKDLLAYSVLGD